MGKNGPVVISVIPVSPGEENPPRTRFTYCAPPSTGNDGFEGFHCLAVPNSCTVQAIFRSGTSVKQKRNDGVSE